MERVKVNKKKKGQLVLTATPVEYADVSVFTIDNYLILFVVCKSAEGQAFKKHCKKCQRDCNPVQMDFELCYRSGKRTLFVFLLRYRSRKSCIYLTYHLTIAIKRYSAFQSLFKKRDRPNSTRLHLSSLLSHQGQA